MAKKNGKKEKPDKKAKKHEHSPPMLEAAAPNDSAAEDYLQKLTFLQTELVKLHPDVEGGSLAEAIFAIDLGAIATNDSSAPNPDCASAARVRASR